MQSTEYIRPCHRFFLLSKNSVGDVFHIADARGITFQDVCGLSDEQVYRMFYPEKHVADATYGGLCRYIQFVK